MLNKDEQQISGVSNSTINQAKGNIINNYGISVKDVIDIVNSVVADKMSVFHKEAEETAKQRLTEFNRELIKKLSAEKAVLISTHILSEIASLCSYLYILSDGKIAASGSERDILEKENCNSLESAFLKLGAKTII